MKRLIIVLCLGLSAYVASAQPELYLEDGTVDPGEEICIPIRGRFFTDIVTIQFSVEFDQEILDFVSIGNFGIASMSNANFDLSQTGNGILTFSWADTRDCQSTNGGNPSFTIDNDEVLFEICFKVKPASSYGNIAEINITGDPVPIVIERIGSSSPTFGCTNLGFVNDPVPPGIVSVSVRPVVVNISEEQGNAGDLVCVNFAVSGFDNMQSMQFNVVWDSTVMELENVVPNGDIPNNSSNIFGYGGNIAANRVTYSWAYVIDGEPGITLPDGTQLFQICYRLLDDSCEKNSAVRIISVPTLNIEVTNAENGGTELEGFNIFFESEDGEVSVNDCDPEGVQVTVDCGAPVNLNDEVCVQVKAGTNWNRVSALGFLLKWNSSILEYKSVKNLTSGFTQADFDAANASNGFLGLDWTSTPFPPKDLNAGDVVFEVCFDVIGLGGNSPINISMPWTGRLSGGPNIGVNPTNCEVVVNQPDGVALSIQDGAAGPGDEFCVDFQTSGFEDITGMQFSLNFDPGLFQLTAVKNINIAGANQGNFNTGGAASGTMYFEWQSNTPVSLADQSSAFQVCFTPLGAPGDCAELVGIDIPRVLKATSATSNGEDIGLTVAPGELCTLFPDGFGLNIGEAEGDWLDTTCVGVSVIEFDNISAASFCISWDPSNLQYTGINFSGAWPGLTEANVDASSANVGLLCFDWDGGSPQAIPDDTNVFDICFKAVGPALECYDITMQETPTPQVTTANGPGSIIPNPGSLCVNDKFYLIDTIIIPASCPGECDGSVEIQVIGGQGQIGTVWFTEPSNQFNPMMAQNLCPGPLTFRVSDNNSPNLVQEFTIDIPLADGVPQAEAGEDRLLGCNPQSVLLSGSGSEGVNFSYTWSRVTSGGQVVKFADAKSAVEFVPGQKIFTVTNNETGCSAMDTMTVIAPDLPQANAGADFEFTCQDELRLDASASSGSAPISYKWTAINNGVIAEGQDTLVNPVIMGPGSYLLKVSYLETGCFDTDTVRVTDGTVIPEVVAGQDKVLDCATGSVTLQSLGNNPGLDVTYEWYDQNNQLLGNGTTLQASQLGTYILVGRESVSNCTAVDTVLVLPDVNYPDVVVDPTLPFTCVRDSVMISATVGPDTISYTFSWTVSNGGQLVPGTDTSLTPIALSPGTYSLAVTNTATSCTAEIDIVISEDVTPPTVSAGPDQAITCQTSSVTLDGAGSDTGAGYTYIWTNEVGDTVSTSITASVSAPGTYSLQVTSPENGCTATDNVNVLLDGNVPQVTITGAQDITCELTTVEITGSVVPAGPTYQFQWFEIIGEDSQNPLGVTTPTLSVGSPGVYRLQVTNPDDGCSGSNQVTIGLDTQAPVAQSGDATQLLTCDEPALTLSAAGSSEGPEFSYSWSGIDPPLNTNQTIQVNTPGTYVLTVRNNNNGCESTDAVEVVDGQQLPVLSFSDPEPAIDCINSTITLQGNVQGATDLSVEWKGLTGGTPEPADALMTTISQPGTYRLIVENNATGCVDSLEITVADNTANPPVVSIAEPQLFTCTTPTIPLDASATGAASSFSSISWVSNDGNTVSPATGSLQVQVDGPGIYELTVVDAATGCSGTGTVTVVPDNDTPQALAGSDLGIECNETGVLDGTASSMGTQFTYQWVNLDGGATPMPEDDLEPAVVEPGTYLLIVANIDNGCVDSDTIVVSRIYPPDANAGADISLCQDQSTTNLAANVPTGTTGMWTSSGLAGTDSATDPNTAVNGLQSGGNVFTWTLSAPGCPNYSQDQVTVYIETAPTPVEDILQIGADNRSVTIDLAQNDVKTNVGSYSVTLLTIPEFGTIDTFNNGVLTYSVPRGFVGVTQATYEICNLDCDDLCATGTLRIFVEDPDYVPTIMNTITPNGDGLNDELSFEILEFTPADEFPDNEIIIFNRWGDIIFQQRPYTNDWRGLNSSGEKLPQGTYYYVLRLNLADGVIIRGDVTVLDNGER
ncbi:MAG: cohesin domain-containing protein [Saprospiraceae bacterium]|nr:gliding motility-associated C-terminal domain-containing protein [Lewinella sp.]